MAALRRILFASDFSPASGRAFTTAVAIAKAARTTLTIVHVIAPWTPFVPEQLLVSEQQERIEDETRRRSRAHLDRLTDKARKAGVRAASLLLEGEPAAQILRAARTTGAGLIVVGTHGRTGLNKFFVGSVAARIVATAACPVLTVRGR